MDVSATPTPPEKILVVRTDRIGDLVLSTPVLKTLHAHFPNTAISVLVNSRTQDIVNRCPFIHRTHVISDSMTRLDTTRLRKDLVSENYSCALILHVNTAILKLVKSAAIPKRIGPASKLSSFLYLNQRLSQNRSQSLHSEAFYNLQLLRTLGIPDSAFCKSTEVWTNAQDKEDARSFLEKAGINTHNTFAIIHPGNGGSALNWPVEHYTALAHKLAELNALSYVMIVGGHHERALLQTILANKSHSKLIAIDSIPSLPVYAEIMKRARIFIASSTGPLHMAHAVGTPTLSFYSPVQVHHPRRWGPYPTHELLETPSGKTVVRIPPVKCPAKTECIGARCRESRGLADCMHRIDVGGALNVIKNMLH